MSRAPRVGDVVCYRLSGADAARIASRRRASFKAGGSGLVGNEHAKGDVVPLVVVRVWGGEFTPSSSFRIDESDEWTFPLDSYGVNGQAILDGNDSAWITSAPHADADGAWLFSEEAS